MKVMKQKYMLSNLFSFQKIGSMFSLENDYHGFQISKYKEFIFDFKLFYQMFTRS